MRVEQGHPAAEAGRSLVPSHTLKAGTASVLEDASQQRRGGSVAAGQAPRHGGAVRTLAPRRLRIVSPVRVGHLAEEGDGIPALTLRSRMLRIAAEREIKRPTAAAASGRWAQRGLEKKNTAGLCPCAAPGGGRRYELATKPFPFLLLFVPFSIYLFLSRR